MFPPLPPLLHHTHNFPFAAWSLLSPPTSAPPPLPLTLTLAHCTLILPLPHCRPLVPTLRPSPLPQLISLPQCNAPHLSHLPKAPPLPGNGQRTAERPNGLPNHAQLCANGSASVGRESSDWLSLGTRSLRQRSWTGGGSRALYPALLPLGDTDPMIPPPPPAVCHQGPQ